MIKTVIETLDKLADQYHAEDFEVRLITPLIEDSFIRLMQENEKTETIEK